MSVPPDAVITYAGVWNVETKYFLYYGVTSPIDNGFYVLVIGDAIVGGFDPSVQPNPYWALVQTGGGGAGTITGVVAGTGLSGGGSFGNVTLDNAGVLSLTAGDNIEITGTASDPIITAIVTIPEFVSSVSAGTGGITVTGTTADPIVNMADTVTSLNGEIGVLSLTSPTSSITITPNGTDIELEVVATDKVTSLNSLYDEVSLTSNDGSITFTPGLSNNLDLAVAFPNNVTALTDGTTSVNGNVQFTSTDNTVTITADAGGGAPTMDFSVPLQIPPVYVAQYYRSSTQQFPTGNTDVVFDESQTWNVVGDHIAHSSGSSEFTVLIAGVYQLEFAVTVLANSQTWTALTKDVSIDITRSPTAEQSILFNRFSSASGLNWANSVVGTTFLSVGDAINCRVSQTLTSGGNCIIQGLQNTFDYNTTFTWRLIKSA